MFINELSNDIIDHFLAGDGAKLEFEVIPESFFVQVGQLAVYSLFFLHLNVIRIAASCVDGHPSLPHLEFTII